MSSITTPNTAIAISNVDPESVADSHAMTSSTPQSSVAPALGSTKTSSPTPTIQLAALFDQFVAAGFHGDQAGAGQITSAPQVHGGLEDLAFLSKPHHSG